MNPNRVSVSLTGNGRPSEFGRPSVALAWRLGTGVGSSSLRSVWGCGGGSADGADGAVLVATNHTCLLARGGANKDIQYVYIYIYIYIYIRTYIYMYVYIYIYIINKNNIDNDNNSIYTNI